MGGFLIHLQPTAENTVLKLVTAQNHDLYDFMY